VPDSITASTPQAFLAASWATQLLAVGVASRMTTGGRALLPGPDPPRFEPVRGLREVQPLVHLRYASLSCSPDPSHLAVLARPGFDGAAPTRPCVSRVRLPPASPNCCDSPEVGTYTPHGSTAPHGARSDRRSRG
jgi:hypothetical protein